MPEPAARPDISALPVFPLAGVTLFPHTHLPLHIFEPRYRALVEDTLRKPEVQHCFAMATPIGNPDAQQQDKPFLMPMAGVGRIIEFSRLPDGRFMLVLQGIGRATLGAELPMVNGYRLFHAEWVQELMPRGHDEWTADLLTELKTLALALLRDQAEKFARLLADQDDLGRLTDLICGYLPLPPDFKLIQFNCVNVMQRAVRTIAQLESMLTAPGKPLHPDSEPRQN